jgi:hypothetical protein
VTIEAASIARDVSSTAGTSAVAILGGGSGGPNPRHHDFHEAFLMARHGAGPVREEKCTWELPSWTLMAAAAGRANGICDSA